MTTEPVTKEVAEPVKADRKPFDPFHEEDVYVTWRILSRNTGYTGESGGFGFSNGESIATALPSIAKCPHGNLEDCDKRTEGQYCRVHKRVRQLNSLLDPEIFRVKDARGQYVTRREPKYRLLTETQYEAEFGDRDEGLDQLPEDF